MMGDRVVLWSGGGRYIAEKDVTSAAIIPSLKILWEGSIYFLSGTSVNITSRLLGGWFATFVYRDPNNSCQPRARLDCIQKNASLLINKDQSGRSTKFNENDINWEIVSLTQEDISTTNWSTSVLATSTSTSACGAGLIRWRIIKNSVSFISATQTLHLSTPDIFFKTKNFIKITSNLNEVIERETTINPIVSDICSIFITFTDSTTLNIPLDYCPTWVQVVPDKQCPPGTCHECEHDGIKCCYSLGQDGLFHLIDSFHT